MLDIDAQAPRRGAAELDVTRQGPGTVRCRGRRAGRFRAPVRMSDLRSLRRSSADELERDLPSTPPTAETGHENPRTDRNRCAESKRDVREVGKPEERHRHEERRVKNRVPVRPGRDSMPGEAQTEKHPAVQNGRCQTNDPSALRPDSHWEHHRRQDVCSFLPGPWLLRGRSNKPLQR